MNKHIDPQIITQNGKPAFAVIPWEQYQVMLNKQVETDESDVWFPNEVVKANIRGDSLIKAWREYLNLTQKELAAKTGMKQSALARLEKGNTTPRKTTLMKIAKAMNIQIEQIVE